MKIAGREISGRMPPYIIAEASCNHGGQLGRALEMIDAAHACGAHAIKFQCYEPESMTIQSARPEFVINDGPWRGKNLWELYSKTSTPFSWFHDIKAHAKKVGITWLASCFDHAGVDLMASLNAPAIKIASFEIVDTPLITYAAATGIPLIISTGMASQKEVNAAYMATMASGTDAAFLHCVSGYPTQAREAQLWRLRAWIANWKVPCGLSDHSIGSDVAVAATAVGAMIIEKHFRLSWHPDTEDSPFSADEVDLMKMVESVQNAFWAMNGTTGYAEDPQRPLRRSLFAVADIKTGELLNKYNVRSIRPGDGLPPNEIDNVIGKKAKVDIERGTPMSWEIIA